MSSSFKKIVALRKKIDVIDQKIIELLERRFTVTSTIQQYKKASGMALQQKQRESEHLDELLCRSRQKKIPEKLVSFIYKKIFFYARKRP